MTIKEQLMELSTSSGVGYGTLWSRLTRHPERPLSELGYPLAVKKNLDGYRPKLVNRKRVVSGEYRSWQMMLNRTGNKNCVDYPAYGGAGISVCAAWLNFDNFILDMGNKPTTRHTLDRIDNSLGYSPENCRWATRKEQSQNRKFIKFYKDGLRAWEWAAKLGITQGSFRKRLYLVTAGINHESTLYLPRRRYRT